MKQTLSIQKIAHLLIILTIVVYFSMAAQSILLPLFFAGLFAYLLNPIAKKIEQFIPSRGVSAFLSFFVVLIPLAILIMIFSIQLAEVVQDLPTIGKKLEEGVNDSFLWINEQIGFSNGNAKEWISKNASKLLEAPMTFLGESISSSTALFANILISLLYTFFLLIYRSSIKNFVLIQFKESQRNHIREVLEKIQNVVQKYLTGMGLVMLILGVINSAGLYFIGLKYALLWGFLAAFLAIIPYIGTFVGGFLPFAYAIATAGNYIQPALVVFLFGTVQALEGNIITPKVVGSSVKVNPLAAILSLVIGSFMWGVAGLILAIPFIAILRVVMSQIDVLKPLSVLLSNDIYGNAEVFEEKFDKERFRFRNFFKNKPTSG